MRGGREIPLGPPPAEDPRHERPPWQVAPLLAAAFVLVGVGAGRAPAATITTVAGGPGAGQATSLGQAPSAIAVRGVFVYVADTAFRVVRRVDTTTGNEIVVAGVGNLGGFSGDGGPATAAELDDPVGVVLDDAGNLFIADGRNQRVRRVDAGTGTITTVAGTGTLGFSGDGGPATAAELYFPHGIVLDGAGNLFIADEGNSRIRRVQFCGDGVVDPGEECDGGAANGTAASCCTFTCTYQLPDTPCSGGSCDGSDVCVPTTTSTSTTTTRPPRTTTTLLACGGGGVSCVPRNLSRRDALPFLRAHAFMRLPVRGEQGPGVVWPADLG